MMPEIATTLSPEEIAARGDKLYHEKIEAQVASAKGQVVAIDVLSGDFCVAANAILAVRDLRTRQPNAVAFGVRIGSRFYSKIRRRTNDARRARLSLSGDLHFMDRTLKHVAPI